MKLTDKELNEMVEVMQECDDFLLGPPEGYESDEDSLGELSTNHSSIEIDIIEDSRDYFPDYDEPVDYYGAYGDYEDYEPSPYDGTYSEE